jgi:hypothetical protein
MASIARPRRLYRNARGALSQRDKAFIANPKDKKAVKVPTQRLLNHVFGSLPSLFHAFVQTFFCCEFYEFSTFNSAPNHTIFKTSKKLGNHQVGT